MLVLGLMRASFLVPPTPARAQGTSVPASPAALPDVEGASARFGALRASPGSEMLRVTAETVSVRCEPAAGLVASCEFMVRWSLVSSAPVETSLYATVDGVEEPLLTAGEATSDAPSLAPLRVRAQADELVEVSLRGRVHVRARSETTDAIVARHPWLATPRPDQLGRVVFTRAVGRTFAAVPDAVSMSIVTTGELAASVLGRRPTPDGTIELDRSALASRTHIAVEVSTPRGFSVRHGGPFLGLGGAFDHGFRARLGYELGLDDVTVLSVAVDSDFADVLVVAALLELASPSFIVPPSVSVGIGPAVRQRLRPSPSGGAETSGVFRLEIGAVFVVVGVVVSFDYVPDDASFTTSLLGRLSI